MITMGEQPSLAAASRMFGDLLASKPRPVTAEEVATVGNGKVRHGVLGQWRYDRPNDTTCGRTATGVERRASGTPIEITCKACIRRIRGAK